MTRGKWFEVQAGKRGREDVVQASYASEAGDG